MKDTLIRPDRRRRIPVRLCDIDCDRRMKAAYEVAQYEQAPEARVDLVVAAVFPSENVYWIAA